MDTSVAAAEGENPGDLEPVVRAIAMDLVTRYQLRLTSPDDSRLGDLAGRYVLAASSWTGPYVALVAFYRPPGDAAAAVADLQERCERARRWAEAQMTARRTCKRADVLLVALGPIDGTPSWSGKRRDAISVGAAWVDGRSGRARMIASGPKGLPSEGALANRAKQAAAGVPAPTLAAVDLAERQGLASNYSQRAGAATWAPSAREAGAVARLRAISGALRATSRNGTGNAGMSLVSFVISTVFVMQWWGPLFGISIMLVTLCHEWGHMVVARVRGIPASAPTFVGPFGAFVRHELGSPGENAWIALSGPLAGAGAAVVVAVVGVATGNETITSAAAWAFGLTLLNLIPFGPLDGARVFPDLSPLAVGCTVTVVGAAAITLGKGDFRSFPLVTIFIIGVAVAAAIQWRPASLSRRWVTDSRGSVRFGATFAGCAAVSAIIAIATVPGGVLNGGQAVAGQPAIHQMSHHSIDAIAEATLAYPGAAQLYHRTDDSSCLQVTYDGLTRTEQSPGEAGFELSTTDTVVAVQHWYDQWLTQHGWLSVPADQVDDNATGADDRGWIKNIPAQSGSGEQQDLFSLTFDVGSGTPSPGPLAFVTTADLYAGSC